MVSEPGPKDWWATTKNPKKNQNKTKTLSMELIALLFSDWPSSTSLAAACAVGENPIVASASPSSGVLLLLLLLQAEAGQRREFALGPFPQ